MFCGTLNYMPNEVALFWFCQKVTPFLEETNWQLWVVGKGASPTLMHFLKQFPQVKLIGEVASVNTYYHQTGIAIVPLQKGSGTRLKILE
ncbi:MAG: glycosyltransferase family 4 protein, partial [Chitinophagaceae bacterium]